MFLQAKNTCFSLETGDIISLALFYVRVVFCFSYLKGGIIFKVPEKILRKIFRSRGEKVA